MSRNFRGGAGFARPENALKRAEELENVGQKHAALQALHDIITSKKHRTWSKTYESIMFKLLDLCVEMKKRNHAKEALMQYRNMCQQVNINSLEEVIKYFMRKATEKAEEAQQQADAVTLDVDDLEEDARPEDIMLSYVSGEKSKDRTDRELVTPWFKFLWETYRSVLEILRTNQKLEALYSMTAIRAFQFCLQYKRTAEFRRLCDILRQHMQNMHKYRERDITQPESLQLHLETRFEQLKVACDLELWAEAFRSVEDIQALIALAKKQPKQQMMATYYAKLTQIFAMSGHHMYHAYAWLKLFSFSKSYNKNLTTGDLQVMGISTLLATLSILPYDRTDAHADAMAAEQEKERTLKMANILGFTVDHKRNDYKNILSKGQLLASLSSMNMLALAAPEVRQLHELLTGDFNPLELCNRLAPLLESISELNAPMSTASPVKGISMSYYVPSLKQIGVLRLLKQLSEVYSVMKISALAELVPFATFSEVEAIIVDAVKYDYLQLRIDHRNGTLHFGSQQLESERVRSHLTTLARRLNRAAAMVGAPAAAEKEQRRAALVQACKDNLEKEHKRALARKIVIEKRKEEQEKELLEAEQREAILKQQAAREAELLEEKRREEERLRREKERLERELEEREQEEAKLLLEQSKKGKAKMKDGEKLDKQAVMRDYIMDREKEKVEMERKLARMAKQLDHLERARREEEVPLLTAAYQQRHEEDKLVHEAQQQQLAEAHRAAWEVDVVEKRRLLKMLPDREALAATIMSRREEEFRALKAARDRAIAEKRAAKKIEREIKRRHKFVERCRQEVQARMEELVEAAKKAEEARKQAELEEKQRRLDEIAAKQREREAEIDRRLQEEKAAAGRAAPPPAAAAAAEPSAGGNKFVPLHLRRAGGAAPAPAAAAAAAAAPSRPEDRWARDRPAEDRWSGSRDSAPPAAEAAAAGGYRPPAARTGASDAPAAAAGGAYRPPVRRDEDRPSEGGAYRPPASRQGASRW